LVIMPSTRPETPPPEELLEELPLPEEELLVEPPEEELPPELELLLEPELLPELEPLLEPELLPPEELLEVHLPPELEAPELEPLELEEQPESSGVLSVLQPYMNVPPMARLVRRQRHGNKARPVMNMRPQAPNGVFIHSLISFVGVPKTVPPLLGENVNGEQSGTFIFGCYIVARICRFSGSDDVRRLTYLNACFR
jgi:hypothetical protein